VHILEMNARFRRKPFGPGVWRESGELADAGALVHNFDGWEDHSRMWRATGDQSASFISSLPSFDGGVIPIFHESPGLIFRPRIIHVRCGKGGDSGGHCGGWCPSTNEIGNVDWYQYPGDGCGGSWRPQDFGIYLQRQAAWQIRNSRLQYNEIIIDGDEVTRRLPHSIEAFFYCKGHSGDRKSVMAVRDAFLQEYAGQISESDVPLVELNLRDWENPFSDGSN
jgi:hypothetical protein